MPDGVRKRRKGEGGKAFKVVELRGGRPSGPVKAESSSRVKAEATARIRNQAARDKTRRPQGRRRR